MQIIDSRKLGLMQNEFFLYDFFDEYVKGIKTGFYSDLERLLKSQVIEFWNKRAGYIAFEEFTFENDKRIDVLAVQTQKIRSNGFFFQGIEIKTARGDFLNDIRSEKWKHYLPYVTHIYFIAPFGIIRPEEIEDGRVGLMIPVYGCWAQNEESALKQKKKNFVHILRQAKRINAFKIGDTIPLFNFIRIVRNKIGEV